MDSVGAVRPSARWEQGQKTMMWTDERVELLKKLWTDGLSASQIAAELGGITRNAVIGRCTGWGCRGGPRVPPPPRRGRASRALPAI